MQNKISYLNSLYYKTYLYITLLYFASRMMDMQMHISPGPCIKLIFLIINCISSEESKSDNSFSSQTANIPPSLSLLFLGHKYLGK